MLLQSCLLLRGMLPVRQLRHTLSKGRRLLRITVQRVREWKVALEGLWAEGSLRIKARLWIKALWAEGSLRIKAPLWIKALWAEGSLRVKAPLWIKWIKALWAEG